MMIIKKDLMTLHQTYTKTLFILFFIPNTIVLGILYLGMFLNISSVEYQANINGIILTNYYIWFVFFMTILMIYYLITNFNNNSKDELFKILSYYLYNLLLTIGLVITYQLLVHLFLPISIVDSLKLLTSIILFNAIYYLFVILFTMVVKKIIKNIEVSLLFLYCFFLNGFLILPMIKYHNTQNILTKIIMCFDFNWLFGRLYLFTASNLFNLSFTYLDFYTEYIFKIIAKNQPQDGDYFILNLYHEINYSFITLFLVIIILLFILFITNLFRNKQYKNK